MSSVQPIIDHDFLDENALPYSLLGDLGHGASGSVDKVQDKKSHKVYARKTIRITGSGFRKLERTRTIFQNEVDIIRGLGRHHHIIRVHATYYTKRNFGILLDPVASDGDLEDFIDEYYGAVETNAVAKLSTMTPIMEQAFGCLASGLSFMHSKKIRHKDIKLRNILVHNGRMIYTDFGYSFDSSGFTHSATGGIASHFTRRYSCPEVLEEQERNSNSDVFSLGCVFIDLFSALTRHGVPVPEGECFAHNIERLHRQVLSKEVPPRLDALPQIIVRMTERNSSLRLSSSHAAAELLQIPQYRCDECAASTREKRTALVRSDTASMASHSANEYWAYDAQHQRYTRHVYDYVQREWFTVKSDANTEGNRGMGLLQLDASRLPTTSAAADSTTTKPSSDSAADVHNALSFISTVSQILHI